MTHQDESASHIHQLACRNLTGQGSLTRLDGAILRTDNNRPITQLLNNLTEE
jgi:hypothetical protein